MFSNKLIIESILTKILFVSLIFLAAGIFTSVTILSGFQVLFAIPLFFAIFEAIKSKNFDLPISAKWLIAFMMTALVSTFINIDQIPNPAKNFGKIKYFLYGVGSIWVLRFYFNNLKIKQLKILTSIFLISICVAGIFCIYEVKILDLARAYSLTDTMRYGYGTAMVISILISYLINKKNWPDILPNWFVVLSIIIASIGMYYTYTRGAMLALFCSVPFIAFYFNKKIGIIFALLIALCVGIVGSYYLFGKEEQTSRFLISKNNGSDQKRYSQWQAAFIAIKERPILGWGYGNFHSQVKRIKFENNLPRQDYNDAHSHNLFLEMAAGTGLIGLFFFLGWLFMWAFEMLKSPIPIRNIFIPFGVVFFICSQFEVTFDANNASMIFFLYPLSIHLCRRKADVK
jgi:O-antigen ligase